MPKKNTSDKDEDKKKSIVLGARKRKGTPAIFKVKEKKQKHTPVVFSLDEVHEYIKKNKDSKGEENEQPTTAKPAFSKHTVTTKKTVDTTETKKRILGAASLSDILGFNPADAKSRPVSLFDESRVDKKFLPYYKALLELRDKVKAGLDLHTKETLKRSMKEDSGDLSSFNLADAGTDTFDRDFALGLVSSEQDVLYEIEEAIIRIMDGTYGVCEITNEPIAKDRLMAVPFTRYSLSGQKQLESVKKKAVDRGSVFSETTLEDSAQYTGEDNGD